MAFANVYPIYVAKAVRKGRSKGEVETIIYWLTGYDEHSRQERLGKRIDFEAFFAQAPLINPNVFLR